MPDKAADERKGNGKKLSFCLKIAEAEGMRGYRKFVRKYATAAGKPREMIYNTYIYMYISKNICLYTSTIDENIRLIPCF